MHCKAKVLAVAVRAKRAEQRQKLGALVTLRIAPTTRNRYALAYQRFCTFITMMCVVLRSLSDIDMAAAWYIEHLWQQGEPKPWGSDTVAALQYYIPHVKRNMVLCWSSAVLEHAQGLGQARDALPSVALHADDAPGVRRGLFLHGAQAARAHVRALFRCAGQSW